MKPSSIPLGGGLILALGLLGCGQGDAPKPSPPEAVKAGPTSAAEPAVKDMKPPEPRPADPKPKPAEAKSSDNLPLLEPPAGAKDERADVKPKSE